MSLKVFPLGDFATHVKQAKFKCARPGGRGEMGVNYYREGAWKFRAANLPSGGLAIHLEGDGKMK